MKRRNDARWIPFFDDITKRRQVKRRKIRVVNGDISHGVFGIFMLGFRLFAWLISLFRLALFHLLAWRYMYFVSTPFCLLVFRLFAWRIFRAKRWKNETAQLATIPITTDLTFSISADIIKELSSIEFVHVVNGKMYTLEDNVSLIN